MGRGLLFEYEIIHADEFLPVVIRSSPQLDMHEAAWPVTTSSQDIRMHEQT